MAVSMKFIHVCLLATMCANVGESHFLAATQAQSVTLAAKPEKSKDEPDYQGKTEKALEKKPVYVKPIEENAVAEKMVSPEEKALVQNAKYPVIMAMHHRLEKVFAKTTDTWYLDWKLWVGATLWAAVWATWLVNGYDENNEVYYQRSLSVFGVNILILHTLEYSSSIRMGMLIVCSALAAQNVFQNYLSFKHHDTDYESARSEEYVCDTVYLDLSLPLEQICILFVAQVGVWWFYMTSILGNFDFGHVNYLFWVWAFLAMQITMIFNRGEDSVLGNAFPVHGVYRLAMKADNVTISLKDAEGDKAAGLHRSKTNIIARGVMGFLCNSILREIMSYTIPLMLMGFSEPMDFVVYCVGVNFICTLDDMGEKTFALAGRSPADVLSSRLN